MNITGRLSGPAWPNGYNAIAGSGSFYNEPWNSLGNTGLYGDGTGTFKINFDASRSWTD